MQREKVDYLKWNKSRILGCLSRRQKTISLHKWGKVTINLEIII